MTSDEYFEELWKKYPSDLCHGKKGAKKVALESWNKYFKAGFNEAEAEKILHQTKIGAAHCRKDIKPDRWPFVSTYINQERFGDVLEYGQEKEERTVLSGCIKQGCNCEVHGSEYKHCTEHTLEYMDNITGRSRQRHNILVDLGLYKQGQSLQETARKCREHITGKLTALTNVKYGT